MHDDDEPRLAIRRHTDRCFFQVEEAVREGYIVQGILIPHDEIAETCTLDENGFPTGTCRVPASRLKPTS